MNLQIPTIPGRGVKRRNEEPPFYRESVGVVPRARMTTDDNASSVSHVERAGRYAYKQSRLTATCKHAKKAPE